MWLMLSSKGCDLEFTQSGKLILVRSLLSLNQDTMSTGQKQKPKSIVSLDASTQDSTAFSKLNVHTDVHMVWVWSEHSHLVVELAR
jgi:hypothetical protein